MVEWSSLSPIVVLDTSVVIKWYRQEEILADQALALGHVRSLAEIRDVVRQSFEPVRYEPEDTEAWNAALERFRQHARGG